MRDRTFRIGVVGAGQVGQICHIATLSTVSGCRVVALADLRPKLLRRAAAFWNIPKVFPNHLSLLSGVEIDAVVVVTGRDAAGPIALDALKAGKAVMCEKPMGHTVDQARSLAGAAASAKAPLVVGYMKRHDFGVQTALRGLNALAQEGTMGALLRVDAWSHAGSDGRPRDGFVMTNEPRPAGMTAWPIAPGWMPPEAAPDYAGFLNVHVHILNLARFMLGALAITSATRRPDGVFDIGLKVRDSGVPIKISCSERRNGEWLEGLSFVFSGGTLTLRLPAPFRDGESAMVEVSRENSAVERIAAPAGWAFRQQAQSFVATLAGAPAMASGEDAVEDLVLAEETWRLLH
jgi:predicted dehydrogenase